DDCGCYPYSSPSPSPSPPPPPQQQDSRPQILKVLEEPSPDSQTPTPEAAAASRPKVVGEGGGGGTRKLRPNLSIVRKSKLEKIRRRSLIGCRSCGLMFCLVLLDSECDRVMYLSLQAADVAYRMIKRQMNPTSSRLRNCFDFCLDQASQELN
ncbi:hypothetical protein LINPERPRIM_LOCUS8531, partial [Linum perenne]